MLRKPCCLRLQEFIKAFVNVAMLTSRFFFNIANSTHVWRTWLPALETLADNHVWPERLPNHARQVSNMDASTQMARNEPKAGPELAKRSQRLQPMETSPKEERASCSTPSSTGAVQPTVVGCKLENGLGRDAYDEQ